MRSVAVREARGIRSGGLGRTGLRAVGSPAVPLTTTSPATTRHWVVAAVPVLALVVVTATQLAHGWAPLSDDAVIATRAWDVFSRAAPLLGQATLASGPHGQTVYDLGPIYYYALALGEHASPSLGPLAAAAVIWAIPLCAFLAAVRSAYGTIGTYVAAATLLLFEWEVPSAIVDPLWNPHAAIIWFCASAGSILAALRGKPGWYVFATVAASMTIQLNISFAGSVLALWSTGTLALLVGARAGPTVPLRLAQGWAIGAMCWIPAALQEVRGRPGNLTAALWYLMHHASMGGWFGAQALSAAVDPRVMAAALRAGNVVVTATFIAREPPVVGIVVVLAMVAIAARAVWLGLPYGELCALGTITCVATAATLGDVPPRTSGAVAYLSIVLVGIGCAVWASLMAGVLDLVARIEPLGSALWPRRLGYVVLLAAAGMLLVRVFTVEGRDAHWRTQAVVAEAASIVEQHVARGPVVVAVQVGRPSSGNGLADYGDAAGMIWRLRVAGWRPEIYGPLYRVFGPTYAARAGAYIAITHVNAADDHIRSIVVHATHAAGGPDRPTT